MADTPCKRAEDFDFFKDYYCGMTVEAIKLSVVNALKYWMGKDEYSATEYDWFMACSYSIRNRMIERWTHTQNKYYEHDVKRVYYLSLEFLIGRLMGNNLYNLGIYDNYCIALKELGFDIEKIRDLEKDAGLGNGGLGRLAACFLDSMTTLDLPAYGYGIRYEFGIFRQRLEDGNQVEEPDEWLKNGNPWELVRPEFSQTVEFEGHVETYTDEHNRRCHRWVNTAKVIGVPYDTPVAGYGSDNVNTLRLWSARAHEQFDFEMFNYGDYVKAVEEKNISENISKVLYPNDNLIQGKELRLKQQYFFVSCTIKDIIRRYKKVHPDFSQFKEKVAIQLNDTHPALGIPELMRILVDIEKMSWEKAWDITVSVFSYTNHTLLPEALERWSVELIKKFLPRHLDILYEINHRFMKQVLIRFNGDMKRLERMSIFEESGEQKVVMPHLCMMGSHSTNGVSALHTELVKSKLAPDFYEMWPERFNNKTNGITPRRWLLKSNRRLADLLTEYIEDKWVTDLDCLKELKHLADDAGFRDRFAAIKRENKVELARYIKETTDIVVNPDSIFDVQAKRMHEYKRQLMNAMQIVHSYIMLKENPDMDISPRTYIFAGKAAPGYFMAKLIIKLINSIGDVVNNDNVIKDRIKVVFLPDYRVSLAEKIIPATDVSEQISTAGMEASGTGNMKFALNGACTIGTLDGANIEIMEEVGADNIYIFGKTADEIAELKHSGSYNPYEYYESSETIRKTLDLIHSGFFSLGNSKLFHPIIDSLMGQDNFFLLADFDEYVRTQGVIDKDYINRDLWFKKAVTNTMMMGKFSSDRTISEYARDIWHAEPYNVEPIKDSSGEAVSKEKN